ncbi:MAG: hypothetical protein HFH94_02460 [Lachnospiraceae bacterium]|nr:hypothetical protein [Lachnospiraceae bacterium]
MEVRWIQGLFGILERSILCQRYQQLGKKTLPAFKLFCLYMIPGGSQNVLQLFRGKYSGLQYKIFKGFGHPESNSLIGLNIDIFQAAFNHGSESTDRLAYRKERLLEGLCNRRRFHKTGQG